MRAAVVTVSDSRRAGTREDTSGPAVARLLEEHGFEVAETEMVSDDRPAIEAILLELCQRVPLIVTTGGTGIGPRDVTPEAVMAVCDRLLPGFGEAMRAAGLRDTPLSPLSRALSGTRDNVLIVTLPGSPGGAVTSLRAVLHLIPHALQLLRGDDAHAGPSGKESHPGETSAPEGNKNW